MCTLLFFTFSRAKKVGTNRVLVINRMKSDKSVPQIRFSKRFLYIPEIFIIRQLNNWQEADLFSGMFGNNEDELGGSVMQLRASYVKKFSGNFLLMSMLDVKIKSSHKNHCKWLFSNVHE